MVGSGVAGRNFPYMYPPIVWVDYGCTGRRTCTLRTKYVLLNHVYVIIVLTSSRVGMANPGTRTGWVDRRCKQHSARPLRTPFSTSSLKTVPLCPSLDRSGRTVRGSSATVCRRLQPLTVARCRTRVRNAQSSAIARAASSSRSTSTTTLALASGENTKAAEAVALPPNIDTQILGCLNSTIGEADPLFNSTQALSPSSAAATLSLILVVLWPVLA